MTINSVVRCLHRGMRNKSQVRGKGAEDEKEVKKLQLRKRDLG